MSQWDPQQAYQNRLEQRQHTLAQCEKQDVLMSQLRGAVFLIAVVVAVLAFYFQYFTGFWLLLPITLFVVLVVWHDRIISKKTAIAQAVAYYQKGLERLADKWQGTGVQDTRFVPQDHVFAADLDLFGKNSLFELLCTARTGAGEEALASYLSQRAPTETVLQRQQAILELRANLDLREDLALLGGAVQAQLQPEVLTRWATAEPAFKKTAGLRVLAWSFTLAAIGGGVLWAVAPVGPLALIVVALFEWGLSFLLKKRLGPVVDTVDRASRELKVLVSLLTRLEQQSMEAPLLLELQEKLRAHKQPASVAIRGLTRLVSWLEARLNQFFAPFAFLLMWSLHFSLAIEKWRTRSGRHIPGWLEALGEMEALCALAGYAYEHPGDVFPEVTEGEPVFVAKDLGHPLLPLEQAVRNDVELGTRAHVWLVSGSNMSGKSTLLRTIGANAVLAMAGAPVRATQLKMTPLSIGSTIRLQDSLMEGASRFYAEISRLKQLRDIADGQPPLLFLLDEILHGTNSHDRRIGAVALIKEFLAAGSIGLVTTHDLAISDAAADLGERLIDVHFVDSLEDDRLVFDYKIRPGVVQKSNALEWMRAVGLKV